MSVEDNSMVTKACIMRIGDELTYLEDQVIFRSEVVVHRKM